MKAKHANDADFAARRDERLAEVRASADPDEIRKRSRLGAKAMSDKAKRDPTFQRRLGKASSAAWDRRKLDPEFMARHSDQARRSIERVNADPVARERSRVSRAETRRLKALQKLVDVSADMLAGTKDKSDG